MTGCNAREAMLECRLAKLLLAYHNFMELEGVQCLAILLEIRWAMYGHLELMWVWHFSAYLTAIGLVWTIESFLVADEG